MQTQPDNTHNSRYHEQQAAKYRAAARSLSPNLPGQNKAYYLRQADYHDSQAAQLSPLPANESPAVIDVGEIVPGSTVVINFSTDTATVTPPATDSGQDTGSGIDLNPETDYHSKLATEILRLSKPDTGQYKPTLRFSFAVWAAFLSTCGEDNWLYFDELVSILVQHTGRHKKTVIRWLEYGENIFFNFGKHRGRKTISRIGKRKVFSYFKLDKPGRVIVVSTEKLLSGSKADLNSELFKGWYNGKQKAFASREIIESITGLSSTSQVNYDKRNNQYKKYLSTNGLKRKDGKPGAVQLPNIYLFPDFELKHPKRKKERKGLYKLDTAETNVVPCVSSPDCTQGTTFVVSVKTVDKPLSYDDAVKGMLQQFAPTGNKKRLLYDNSAKAAKAGERRFRLGEEGVVFAELETIKHRRTKKPIKGWLSVKTIHVKDFAGIDKAFPVVEY